MYHFSGLCGPISMKLCTHIVHISMTLGNYNYYHQLITSLKSIPKMKEKNKDKFLNNKKIVFFFQENLELFF